MSNRKFCNAGLALVAASLLVMLDHLAHAQTGQPNGREPAPRPGSFAEIFLPSAKPTPINQYKDPAARSSFTSFLEAVSADGEAAKRPSDPAPEARNKSLTPREQQQIAEIYLGDDAQEKGRFQEAYDHFTEAMRLQPRASLLQRRASTSIDLNRLDEALADADEAEKLLAVEKASPAMYASLYGLKSHIYLHKGNDVAAEAMATRLWRSEAWIR